MTKAVVLFSGGLDSLLTVRLLQEQNIEVLGLNVVTPFFDGSPFAREKAASLDIPLFVHHCGPEYLKMVASPRFGYGKALNPCLDCRVLMCRAAKQLMDAENAQFVATGEVAGQRPNSQKQHQLSLISRESGLCGFLLRPLSAKVLSPTTPELEGWVDREKLHAYTGRGRIALIALARKLAVGKIPQPSTGCLLCEQSYAPRLRDLLKYGENLTNWDVDMLNNGRQIRITPEIKCVMGRNEEQCTRLQHAFSSPDRRTSFMLVPENFNGPTTLFIGVDENTSDFDDWFNLAGSLTLRFTNSQKFDAQNVLVQLHCGTGKTIRPICPDSRATEYKVIT
ncbi:MAG: hypothetical protein ACRC10_04055 [Thermoguttaceae bacterium]